ncbi:MAG: phosphoglycerate mutase family protein [Rubricoccaceae bacterium]
MRPVSLLLVAALALAACAQPVSTPDASPTIFLLVRHAEKLGGSDPGLTPEGQARAHALADVLAHADVDLIVSSQFRRTQATAAPLAERLSMEVETRDLDLNDAAGSSAAIALELAESHAGQTILMVGHSNTIPRIASALTGIPMEDLDERDYDNLFVVIREGSTGQLIRTRFGATDPVP